MPVIRFVLFLIRFNFNVIFANKAQNLVFQTPQNIDESGSIDATHGNAENPHVKVGISPGLS